VARSFQIYGTVLVAGSAFTAFWSVIPDSLVKAHQDTRSTMWAGILSGTVNVLFNTLFLFVFHWGVFGIALSTCFGRVAGLVYALGRARVHERRRLREEVPRTGRDDRPYRALLRLAVPASLTFALMAGETALINWFLARGAHPTAAIAAYSIYYRVNLFLLNPIIAVGVAMLPYAARRFGRGDFAGIRRGLQEAGWASIAYCLALVAPLMWPLAPWLARVLCESDLTAEYTTLALRLVPLACLTAIPFMICRTAFEALQQWRPGLILAVVRYALLAAPAAWLGGWVAARNGLPELYGILAGLLGLAIGTSLVFLYWLMHYLRRCAASACIDPTAASGPHTPGQG
jgi:Na+-driven multidrug efflux pump